MRALAALALIACLLVVVIHHRPGMVQSLLEWTTSRQHVVSADGHHLFVTTFEHQPPSDAAAPSAPAVVHVVANHNASPEKRATPAKEDARRTPLVHYISKDEVLHHLQQEVHALRAKNAALSSARAPIAAKIVVKHAEPAPSRKPSPVQKRPERIQISIATPPPEPVPTHAPTVSPVEPKTVITTITSDSVRTENGITTNVSSVNTTVDNQSVLTGAPVNATEAPDPTVLTKAPVPRFVVNVITDSTPLPTVMPTLATALPTAEPSCLPSTKPTATPTYDKGTYVVNVDVSGLPKHHGALAVPVAMPDGAHTTVQIPAST